MSVKSGLDSIGVNPLCSCDVRVDVCFVTSVNTHTHTSIYTFRLFAVFLSHSIRRTDRGTLRRVRAVQRSSPSGAIGPKRIVIPPEIVALEQGKAAQAYLGVIFAGVSDRDGSLHAKFEIKSDRNSTPVDFKPPIVELLRPIQMKSDEFETAVKGLHGFQRMTASFDMPTEEDSLHKIPTLVLQCSSMVPVDKNAEWAKDKRFRLVGGLPASTEKVYAILEQPKKSSGGQKGKIVVCCDNALATNSVLDSLKKAVQAEL